MELIEKKLRDFLHDLLMGENSPINIIVSNDILKYIKGHLTNIAKILTIEVELHDNFEEKASWLNRRLNLTDAGFVYLKGSYEIVSEHVQNCSFKDFYEKQTTFITAYDFAKEEEDKKFRSGLIDIQRDLPLNIQQYDEKHTPASLFEMKRDLKLNILNDKDIDEYAVFRSVDVIYGKTYKLALVLFSKKITLFPMQEIKLKYYTYYVPEEFEKLKYELEKYFAKKHYQTHIEILQYYEEKFISRKKEQSDPNYKKCYELIITGIRNLVEHLKEYFEIIEKKSQIPIKLQWNADYKKFIDFFEILINEEEIQYKGNKDKCAIYYILLDKIDVKNNGAVSIDSISRDLGFAINKNLEIIEICKLDYKKSMTTFVKKFSPLIYIPVPGKSALLLNGKSSRDPIVKKLFNLFSIISESAPYEEIEERSLIVTFKKVKLV